MKISRLFSLLTFGSIVAFGSTPAAADEYCLHWTSNVYPAVNNTDTIYASQNIAMGPGSYFYSNSGNYFLTFQADGNLVYYRSPNSAQWASDTQACVPTPYVGEVAIFQADGNLVVYFGYVNNTPGLVPMWDSGTQGHPNARLVAQDDGNLVIYDGNEVLWSIF